MDELRAEFVRTWLEILACTPSDLHALVDERISALLHIARQLEE